MAVDTKTQAEIDSSRLAFDIARPLTDEELRQMGQAAALPGTAKPASTPLLHDPETEAEDAPVEAEPVGPDDYNALYAHFISCQAIAALAAFKEGWEALQKSVLRRYVRNCRLENERYRGDDPNKAFSLRLRQQSAEDFLKFINSSVAEASQAKKPSLKKD